MKTIFKLVVLILVVTCTKQQVAGPVGATGAKGNSGSSCTATTVSNGIDINCPGSPTQFISNGSNGSQGVQGNTGASGNNGSSGSDGYSAAFGQAAADVSVCPNGGNVINMGLDINRNNTLDPSEITESAIICNGQNGMSGQAGLDGTNGANGGTVTFNLVQAIEPCGASSSPNKEVLLGLQGGQLLSDFSETAAGQNTRLSFMPNGSYADTDSSGCNFSVSGDGVTNSSITWGTGSNSYSSWPAGGFSWTSSTGWIAL